MTQYGQDEILELLWTLREEGKTNRSDLLRGTQEEAPESLLEELRSAGQVEISGDEIRMTRSGEDRARGIIRRHRLAEVLLHNLFEIEPHQLDPNACQFEHILSEEVTESVCTFLGHPPVCPHGKSIPRGGMLRLHPDERAAPRDAPLRRISRHPRADRLHHPEIHEAPGKALLDGIVPGSNIRLMQRNPSHVLQIGQTTIAVDKEITDEIYVKQA